MLVRGEIMEDLKGARVLLVDDDDEALSSMRRMLEAQGACALTAGSLEEVRVALFDRPGALDAAIVDLELDASNSTAQAQEVVRELRTRYAPCCVGVFTGWMDSRMVGTMVGFGVEEVLYKPVAASNFLRFIHRLVLRTRQLRANLARAEEQSGHRTDGVFVAEEPTEEGEERQRWLRLLGARYGLTPAEAAVSVRVLERKTNEQIALELGIKRRTVKLHVSAVLGKCGLRSRHDLLPLLMREGADRAAPNGPA